jgi:hypothetical protein
VLEANFSCKQISRCSSEPPAGGGGYKAGLPIDLIDDFDHMT